MTERHRRLTFALLPVVFLLRGLSAGVGQSVWVDQLTEAGLTPVEIADFFANASLVVGSLPMLAALIGGGLGLLVGPAPVLLLGLLLSAGGFASASLVDGTASLAPMALADFGLNLSRIGVWACAALPLAGSREPHRNALFLLLWGVMNGAFQGSGPLQGVLLPSLGLAGVCLVAGLLAVAAAVVAAPLVVAGHRALPRSSSAPTRSAFTETWVSMREAEAGPARAPANPAVRVHLMAGVLILACFLSWGSHDHVYNLLEAQWRTVATSDLGLITINQALATCIGLLLPVFFWLQVLRGVQVPALIFVGLGMALAGPATLLLLVPGLSSIPTGLIGVLVLLTVAELLIGPLLLSRIAGDLHWRVGCLVIGVWLAMSSGVPLSTVNEGLVAAGIDVSPYLVPGMLQALGSLVGLVLLFAAVPLHRRIWAPVATPDGS